MLYFLMRGPDPQPVGCFSSGTATMAVQEQEEHGRSELEVQVQPL